MEDKEKELLKKILLFLSLSCSELPSNIYFISKALPMIFIGEHIKP